MSYPCPDSSKVEALWRATDLPALEQACVSMIEDSPHVSLDLGRLSALDDVARQAEPTPWTWMFDPASQTDAECLFDAAWNASLLSGMGKAVCVSVGSTLPDHLVHPPLKPVLFRDRTPAVRAS